MSFFFFTNIAATRDHKLTDYTRKPSLLWREESKSCRDLHPDATDEFSQVKLFVDFCLRFFEEPAIFRVSPPTVQPRVRFNLLWSTRKVCLNSFHSWLVLCDLCIRAWRLIEGEERCKFCIECEDWKWRGYQFTNKEKCISEASTVTQPVQKTVCLSAMQDEIFAKLYFNTCILELVFWRIFRWKVEPWCL